MFATIEKHMLFMLFRYTILTMEKNVLPSDDVAFICKN